MCDPLFFLCVFFFCFVFFLGTAVSSTAETTSTSTSLFKIPTAGAVTSAGTITTTTTQSLITPVLATGGPQGTTGAQKGPVTSTYISISQGSAVPSLQSQQALGPVRLLSNLSSIPGSSTGVPLALTSTSGQTQPVVTASTSERANLSNTPTIGSQATIPQTTATASQGTTGFQLSSSASSLGNSLFTKPPTANQLTSSSDLARKNTPVTNTNSAQNTGFSFPGSSAAGTLGTLANAGTAGPGGFNFAATSRTQNALSLGQSAAAAKSTSGTSSLNSSSTFSTAQKPVALTGNSLTANSQNSFGSLTKPAQSSSVPSASSTSSVFGQSANTAQGSFGSTTQNKVTFGSTNMKSITGQQSQSPFGIAPSNAPGFGASVTQNAFGTAVNKSSTKSAFTFAVQANQNASQSTTLTNPTQNAFGVQQQNQKPTPSAFGQASNGAFSNRSTDKAAFTFSSQGKQNTTQNAFGSQTTQNVFGSQPNQNANQGSFGTQPTQNVFGTQATQNAFGTPSNQKPSSSFSFAVNTAQNASSSPISGFGNKVGTQSAFGAAPSQNAAGTSSGFSFAAAGSNPTPGGFNFNSAASKPTGFQFGKLHEQLSFMNQCTGIFLGNCLLNLKPNILPKEGVRRIMFGDG